MEFCDFLLFLRLICQVRTKTYYKQLNAFKMNSKLPVVNLFFIMLFNLSVSWLNGQTDAWPALTGVKTHLIKSSQNKKEYRLQVLLPTNYTEADSTRYPVLYVLDGEYSTLLFYSVIKTFSLAPEVNDVIVVTIDGNTGGKTEWLTSRYYDYTPSHHPQTDTAIAKFFKIPVTASGGASTFLVMLESQLMPLIEKHYKTNDERGLFGHSLGGLFGSYCLIHRPGLFQKYSLNSPSLWWNNGELIPQIDALTRDKEISKEIIFLSAGSSEGSFMITPVERFEKSLKNKFPGIKLTYKIFDDETHLSVVPVVISRTLKTFYANARRS